jgi:hypothetical protein
MLDGNGLLDIKEEAERGQQTGVRRSNMAPRAKEGMISAPRVEPASYAAVTMRITTSKRNSSSELKIEIRYTRLWHLS